MLWSAELAKFCCPRNMVEKRVKFILSHHFCDIISRKTKYPTVIFSPKLELSSIFKVTLMRQGL
jgi:hypothetical protein